MSGGDHGGDFGGGDFGGDFGYGGDDANNVGGMQIQADVHQPSLYFERDSERPAFDQSWVLHLWRNEPRLLVLSGLCKILWSATLMCIMYYLHEMGDVATGNFDRSKDVPKALSMCFGLIPLMVIYSIANLGKEYCCNEMASKTKARLAALIAEHCLLSASTDPSERSIALSLASSETNQVCEGALNIHLVWGSVLEVIAINTWFLMRGAGPGLFGAIGCALCVAALLWIAWISVLMKRARSAVASLESKQTATFVEYIANIRTFRLNGLDAFIQRKLNRMTDEMQPLRSRAIFLKMLNILTSFTLSPAMCVIIAISSASVNGRLTPSLSRSIFDLFDLNKYPLLALPSAARACSNATAAYERIFDYLRRPPCTDTRQRLTELPGVVELEQLPVGPNTVLHKWRAEAGSLWVLLGPVGSFKSTILEILAGHASVAGSAAVRFGGTMSYAPQLHWIQQTTIKDNIICFEPWNERRYKAVLHACALEHDLKTMPMHDQTIVAEKGLNLSGGQKQRLALARAVYREADIYLLDNPLSAIDDQTQEHIWKHLIEGLLQNATVVVASSRPVVSCTAVLHLSPEGLLRQPEIVQGWCSAVHASEAAPRRYSKSSFSAPEPSPFPPSHQQTPHNVSLSRKSAVDAAVGDVLDSVLLYEAFEANKQPASPRYNVQTELQSASVDEHGRPSFLEAGKSSASFRVGSQHSERRPISFLQHLKNEASEQKKDGCDGVYSCDDVAAVPTSALHQRMLRQPLLASLASDILKTDEVIRECSLSSSKIGIVQFIDACELRWSWAVLILIYPAYQLMRTYFSYWSGFWQNLWFGLSNYQYQILFGSFVLMLMSLRLLNDYVVYQRCSLDGIVRIRKAFSDSICNAPLSFFMSENIGKIATVYSRDLVSMSESFVDALHYAAIYFCVIFAVFLRMMWEIPYFAIPLVSACIPGVWVMLRYAKKLKAAKLNFQEADDDVFRAMCNAIEGVKVIRTANVTNRALENVAAALQNWRVATVATDRVAFWLFTRMEPIGHLLAFATCIMSTQLETGKPYGVSLSLEGISRRNMVTQALSFLIFFPIAAKRISLAYAGMSSVEKVFQYIQDVPREQRDGIHLEKSWPASGKFELKDLCLRYSPALPNALNNISLNLAHGAKVGVCGRTGCGKSSLFAALFRLVQPHAGEILVAGRSILNADVNALRARMCIIPQDPVMFGGTLRENIDPLNLFPDSEIQEALAVAGLEGEKADLNRVVKTSGEGWSQGQKQLVCLARVVLKKPALLFMDEATAALDQETEARFQRVVASHFESTTIVCVAHRLENFKWCQTKIEMSQGQVLSVTKLR